MLFPMFCQQFVDVLSTVSCQKACFLCIMKKNNVFLVKIGDNVGKCGKHVSYLCYQPKAEKVK